MEVLTFIVGFLCFCGVIGLFSYGVSHFEDYTEFMKQEYGQHHEYHE